MTSAAAIRQKRHRDRESQGKIVLQVELPEAELVELLLTAGLLDQHRDFYDRTDLAEGVVRFLSLARHA